SVNDGLLNGNSIEYFENGKLKEIAIFQNGRLDQTRILFHKNGLISEFINYNDGVLNGSYFSFWPNKSIKSINCYENGLLTNNEKFDLFGKKLLSN
ncbi:MAG: hypothetical protein O3A16_07535, partial [Bacteroidetes bacterium]|nr:hypothetical protein [Bacteroidota bacterium]